MPTLFNWDVLGSCGYIDVKSSRLAIDWHLRDDVDSPLVMRFVAFMAKVTAWQENLKIMQENLQNHDEVSGEEIQDLADQADAFGPFNGELTSIVGDMVRWTYPDVTDDLVARLSYNQRRDLAQAFFTQAGNGSASPPSSTSANRAQRRATSRR